MLFVPGRLCLFGEHSDWAAELGSEVAGACLVTGTDQGISAKFEAAADFRMQLPASPAFVVPMQLEALQCAAQDAGFYRYAAGTALEVLRRWPVRGVHLQVLRADLPVQRGLSSSAAACVLVVRAFNQCFQLGLDPRREMEIAYLGEQAAGSLCGRMDQVCAFGQRPVLLQFSASEVELRLLHPGGDIFLLIADLQAEKNTRRILHDLHAAYLGGPQHLREPLRRALGPANQALVGAAADALQQGDASELGRLMNAAQELFDRDVMPGCPSELRAPRLHDVLAQRAVKELAWGGKGVGSQGDGAAQIVCRGEAERQRLQTILESRCGVLCLPLTIRADRED